MSQNQENPSQSQPNSEHQKGDTRARKVRRTLRRFFENTYDMLGAVEAAPNDREHVEGISDSITTHRDITAGTVLDKEHPDARAMVSLEDMNSEPNITSQYTANDKFDRLQLYPDSYLTAQDALHYIDNRKANEVSMERLQQVMKDTEPPHDPHA